MATKANKELVQRFIEQIVNQGRMERMSDFFLPGSILAGGLAGQLMVMRTAFPDNHLSIEEMVAEGDKVAVRATTRGTNSGPLAGLPAFGSFEQPMLPTGKPVMVTFIYIFTLKEGKITGFTSEFDQVGMLQQLGWVLTPPA